MQENLVIVESPAKAKTIEKFLGKDFVVKSSFGHIRDLSKKDLGVNLDKDYEPVYEIPSDKRKVVEELSSLAKKTKTVWLASDEDREGEAIAWHLAEVLWGRQSVRAGWIRCSPTIHRRILQKSVPPSAIRPRSWRASIH